MHLLLLLLNLPPSPAAERRLIETALRQPCLPCSVVGNRDSWRYLASVN